MVKFPWIVDHGTRITPLKRGLVKLQGSNLPLSSSELIYIGEVLKSEVD